MLRINFLRGQVRNLASASSSSGNATAAGPFYAIKDQVDQYIYARSLPRKWKPVVYREKNADLLTSLDAVDNDGRPIVPRKYPGIPSKTKFARFIDDLLLPEELNAVKETISKMDKYAVDFFAPSVINSLLYKSAEFGTFGRDLTFVYNLQNYRSENVFGPRNIEAIILLRAIQAEQYQITDLNWVYRKLRHVFKHNQRAEKETLLIYASNLALLRQIELNRKSSSQSFSEKEQAILAKKIDKVVEALNKKIEDPVYKFNTEEELKDAAKNFDRWQHAYSILKLLQRNLDESQVEVGKKILPFLEHVEKLQEAAKIDESLLARLEKIKFRAEAEEGEEKPNSAEEADQAENPSSADKA
ncbi:DEKNAAC104227 [Brettanomyces naardenensis]|uniref:DEKNAAC104227 n=1 Tax=Brettanomyces naardenensis TaxID=13370 RepID=A0A448YPU0_BRENA|nr:DEKNAAC104227 [Brettanomyces naardenensis]